MNESDNKFDIKQNAQLMQLIEKMRTEQSLERNKAKGVLNLYDINRISHLENYHSNILAYLLDEKQEHHHPEYIQQFIHLINDKHLKKPLPPFTSISVTREKLTDANRRIDIFLESNEFILIIENKIYATDQEQQLLDYYDWGINKFHPKKKVILCYLTLFGSHPSETSLSKATLDKLTQEEKHIALSYSEDILDWLESLKVKKEEEILWSALIQYKDLVMGLCKKRERNIMELKEMINNMEEMGLNTGENDLKQITKNAVLIQQGCQYFLYLQFLSRLRDRLLEVLNDRGILISIYYTHHQYRYEAEKKLSWEQAVIKDFEYIGLELSLGDSVGIGIEIDTITYNPKLYFGIMTHGQAINRNFHLMKTWDNGGFRIIKSNNEWWGESVSVNYVIEELFSPSGKDLPIVTQVSSWFVDQWNYSQKFF
jgi:hypothetical protein